MSARPTPKPAKTFVSTAIVLILATALGVATAFAKITLNTIDPTATVTDNGRQIILTGPIQCDGGQQADLRVTVTQRSTGAVAEGRVLITCTGDTRQWEVRALTQGKETFAEGPAIAVASARTSDHGRTDDAHQWLVGITLVGK